MLFRMLNRFRSDPLRAEVEASIRAGTGLHKGEWLLTEGARSAADLAQVSAAIDEWCRDQMQGTRRPYGIDQMALAVACAEPGGEKIASATFGVFRPVDFYREGGVADQMLAFVRGLPLDDLQRSPSVRFAAALFSWGDVARETIFSDEREEAAG